MQWPRTHHFDSISITIESPDTMLAKPYGYVDKTTATILIDEAIRCARDQAYMLYLFDISCVDGFSVESRKIMTSSGHLMPPRILAAFGGSFAVRVAFESMDRASWLLGSQNRQIQHWPDERSARAWAASMRGPLEAQARMRSK